MLNFMRKHAQSWLIKTMFLIIILVFTFWGIGTFRTKRQLVVAKVNGQPIYYKEYATLLRQVIDNYRLRFKEFNDEWIKRLHLKQTVLNQLIERELLLQQAKKMGIVVTNSELWQRIASYKAFQKNGRFDPHLYVSILARYHYTPEQFEETLKEDMLISKVRQLIENLAHVSDAELWETYKWLHQKINLEFLSFNPESFVKEVKVNSKALLKFFEANKQNYLIPRKIKIAYVKIPFDRFLNQIKVSDEEIKKYYELNKNNYYQPKMVCARHILFKIPPKANKKEIETVKNKAQKVLEKLKQGASFTKLAQKYSDDKATAVNGGDLGCFPKGVMVKPFEDTAFSLKKGEFSGLVKTRFGYHIIQVYDIKPAHFKPLKEVKSTIIAQIKHQKAKEMALKLANQVYAQAVLSKDLKKAALQFKLKVKTSGFLSADNWSNLPEGIKKDILALKKGELSVPLEIPQGYLLCQVIEEVPQHVPSFEEVKDKVKEDWIQKQAQQLAKDKAELALKELKKTRNLNKIASQFNLKVQETGYFTPGWIPRVGFNLQVVKDLFSLSPKDPILPYVAEVNGNYYIFVLKDRHPANKNQFKEQKDKFKQQMLAQRKAVFFNTWVKELKRHSKIEIKENMIH